MMQLFFRNKLNGFFVSASGNDPNVTKASPQPAFKIILAVSLFFVLCSMNRIQCIRNHHITPHRSLSYIQNFR